MSEEQTGRDVLVTLATVIGGAVIGGGIGFSTGYFSLIDPIPGNLGSILWYFSMLGFFGGIGAPFAAMSYLRKYVDNAYLRATLTSFGYILLPASGVIVAYIGLVGGVDMGNAVFLVLSAFNLLFGVVLGGIIGHRLSYRILRERGLSEEWQQSTRTDRFNS